MEAFCMWLLFCLLCSRFLIVLAFVLSCGDLVFWFCIVLESEPSSCPRCPIEVSSISLRKL
ncbi:similar to RIKEN cDNA 4632404H22 (predicted), isoform CRA_b [Rattus norvegicus]|uniref:Uncharacterized protein n=1 Tax=Rattus norvegicus TaxID=10116 RepID=A6KUJ5_RAT|nr:similar to RIKEN cDNA 4632404H22 (predicted), isoform CRA_b [Rattus norvegicus]